MKSHLATLQSPAMLPVGASTRYKISVHLLVGAQSTPAL